MPSYRPKWPRKLAENNRFFENIHEHVNLIGNQKAIQPAFIGLQGDRDFATMMVHPSRPLAKYQGEMRDGRPDGRGISITTNGYTVTSIEFARYK